MDKSRLQSAHATNGTSAEAALRLKEAELELIADNAPVILSRCSRDGRYLYANRACAKLFGRTPAELIGKPIVDIMGEQAFAIIEPYVQRVLNGERVEYEAQVPYNVAGSRWVHVNYVPERDADNEVTGWLASVIDITGRKRAERALAESEQRKEAMFESSLDCIITMDHEGRIADFNPAAERTFGYRREDVVGRTLAQTIIPERLREQHRQRMARFLKTGEGRILNRRLEMPALRADGSEFPAEIAITVVRTSDDAPPFFTGYLRDITKRKAAEQALIESEQQIRESEERFRTLADSISQFAWIADETGWISWYNHRWFEFTGTTLEQMQGRGWRKVHHPEHVDRVTEKFKHHIDAGVEWEDTFPLRGKDGRYRWFLSRARPICNDDGRIVRWFGTNTDITEQREAEEALRKSEQRYRHLVGLLPVAVYSCEAPSGLITFYNEQAAALWGRAPKIGDTDERFCGSYKVWRQDGTQIPRDQTPMALAIREGRACRNQHAIVERPDGTRIHALVNTDPIRDDNGRIIGAINAFYDTTALNRAQDALRESERRLSTLVSNLPGMVYRCSNDHERTMQFVSVGVSDIAGYSLADFAAGHVLWSGLTHPDDVERLRNAVHESIHQREPFQIEYRIVHKDGSVRWVLEQGQGVLDDRGALVAVEGFVLDVTRRKLADQALDESQQRLQIAKESAQLGIYDYHVPSGNIDWDARAREVWGLSADEHAAYDTFLEGLHPDDREPTNAAVARAVDPSGDGNYYAEYRVINRLDGRTRWVAATGRTTFRNGVADRLIGSVQDITRRKQAEESRALLATIVESSDDAMVSKTLDGVILSWNAGAERLFGYTASEAIGQSINIIIPEDRDEEERSILDGLRRGEHITNFDTVRRRKDDRLIDISLSVSPIRSRSGAILGASKVARDISERKEADSALRESEEQFRRAIEESPIPVIMHAEDGEVLQISRSWTALTGYDLEEMPVVPDWLSAAYGQGGADIWTAVQSTFESDAPLKSVEFDVITRDGERRTWSFSASSPGRLRDGRRFIVGMAEDITSRTEHAEQREVLLAELSHRVKNMLATVSSIAAQTVRQSGSLEEFSSAFLGRLRALSNVHGMLTRNRLSGADLGSVIRKNIEAYCTSESRFHISGPRTRIAASDALALTLVFHELTTNAVKYGSLSSMDGQIHVQWERNGENVRIVWREIGGPPVKPPKREGFGSELMRQEIEYGLEGSVGFDYDPDGLVSTLEFPLRDSTTPPYH